jgi:3-oxoacyl-[acyl-carrier-protein] synthase-1
LFVGFSEREDPSHIATVLESIRQPCGSWPPRVQEAIQGGRASALYALHRACDEIRAGKLTGALVGGVDSLIRPSVHAVLGEAGVLKDVDENPQGIVPGEAAAFVVLEARPKPAGVLACVAGTGIADEPTLRTQKPNQGEGLTAAVRMAKKGTTGMTARPLSVCDLNGDRYRALEWGFAQTRALADLTWKDGGPGTEDTWNPAEYLGDTGAGACAVCTVWAIEAIRLGCAPTREVLLWGTSDSPLRAAAILGPP